MQAKSGVDAQDLAQSGWGLIMAVNADPAILGALDTLRTHRRAQARGYYREYYRVGEAREEHKQDGYRPDERWQDWLVRHGVAPGNVDPQKVPYYLLIVGDPEAISYAFQSQLSVEYAVGRIHFRTLEEYANYAQSVVAAESGHVTLPRQAAFFGAQNPGDPVTEINSTYLVRPLAKGLDQHADWGIQTVLGPDATKARLTQLLGGKETPAVLFTASHGIGFANGDPRQLSYQGALLCQDWPGPSAQQPISPGQYFAAADLSDEARLHGLISIHYASYSVGTPRYDEFALQALHQPTAIAPRSFVTSLPQRLLSHPAGGALAVIGHASRAWGYWLHSARARQWIQAYGTFLASLLAGNTVGSAMESLTSQHASSATDLSRELDSVTYGKVPDHLLLSDLWMSSNDFRNTMIIGDPAVRLHPAPPALPNVS